MKTILHDKLVNIKAVVGKSRRNVTAKFLDENNIELRLPKGFYQDIEVWVEKNKAWLEKAYKRFDKKRPTFRKSSVMYHGQYYPVRFFFADERHVEFDGVQLIVKGESIFEVKDYVLEWMEQQTTKFVDQYRHIFPKFGVKHVEVKRSITRWGSCHSGRKITFNPQLSALPVRLMEYVLYHELAHTLEMNHSARFKARLKELIHDYREREKEMNGYVL